MTENAASYWFQNAPDWAAWVAQDADGTWWAYAAHPNQHDSGWYENEVGRIQRLGLGTPLTDWHTTLCKR